MAKSKERLPAGAAFRHRLDAPAPDLEAEEDAFCGCTGEEALAMAMLKKAMRGDTAAARFVMEMAAAALPAQQQNDPVEVRVVVVRDGV